MCFFVNITHDNLEKYFSNVAFLLLRHRNFLVDDFKNKQIDESGSFLFLKSFIIDLMPFFWVVLERESGDFAGFVYLDNFTGSTFFLHSAEITGCIERKFRGSFSSKVAGEFFSYCFNILKLNKIKAQIYPQNFCVKALLIQHGFQKEGTLKAETICRGKLQDIDVYGLLQVDFKNRKGL